MSGDEDLDDFFFFLPLMLSSVLFMIRRRDVRLCMCVVHTILAGRIQSPRDVSDEYTATQPLFVSWAGQRT